MGAYFRFSAAKNPRSLRDQMVACDHDIIDLVTDMMDAAGGIFIEKFPDWRARPQGVQQLYLGIFKFNKNNGDAVLRLIHWFGHVGPQHVPVTGAGGSEVGDGNGDVV